jgi:hypothetical protein
MKRLTVSSAPGALVALGLWLFSSIAAAQAKPSCTAGKTGKPESLTAKEAWDLASARAREWAPDAIPFDFTTTSSWPLDSEGKSKEWEAKFSSEKAKAVDMISISEGQIRCYAISGAGGRVLTSVDQITFDSKKLYDAAQKAGGDKVAGATVMVGLDQGTGGVPNWHLNYADAKGKEVLSIVFDARTGKVINVFHSK